MLLALSQLKKLINLLLEENLANYYEKLIKEIEFIEPAQVKKDNILSNHIFPVRINFAEFNIKRNDLMIYLRKHQYLPQVHYIPIPIHPYYKEMDMTKKFVNNMTYFNEALTLPLYYQLKNSQIDYVLGLIKHYFE